MLERCQIHLEEMLLSLPDLLSVRVSRRDKINEIKLACPARGRTCVAHARLERLSAVRSAPSAWRNSRSNVPMTRKLVCGNPRISRDTEASRVGERKAATAGRGYASRVLRCFFPAKTPRFEKVRRRRRATAKKRVATRSPRLPRTLRGGFVRLPPSATIVEKCPSIDSSNFKYGRRGGRSTERGRSAASRSSFVDRRDTKGDIHALTFLYRETYCRIVSG